MTSYWEPILADNKSLARNDMPYRYGASGIALCARCGQKYFRADRQLSGEPDCDDYDPFHEGYEVAP